MSEFDVKKSIAAQRAFSSIGFSPADGICYRCREQIYAPKEHIGWQGRRYATGISTEEAGTRVITGCPHCNYSFCE